MPGCVASPHVAEDDRIADSNDDSPSPSKSPRLAQHEQQHVHPGTVPPCLPGANWVARWAGWSGVQVGRHARHMLK